MCNDFMAEEELKSLYMRLSAISEDNARLRRLAEKTEDKLKRAEDRLVARALEGGTDE